MTFNTLISLIVMFPKKFKFSALLISVATSAIYLTNCGTGDKAPPPVEKEKFIAIMTEFALLEAHFEELPYRDRDSVIAANKAKFLKEQQLDDSIFNQAIYFYNRDRKQMNAIENEILNRIEKLKSSN